MKWYKVIERVSTLPNSFVAGRWDLGGAEESDFTSGVAFSRLGTNQIRFWASGKDEDGEPDDFLINNAMLPIYSEQLQQALKLACIGGIEFHPIDLRDSSGKAIGGFCVANIIAVVSCIDYAKSNVVRFPKNFPESRLRNQIRSITGIVLQERKLVNLDILRVPDYLTPVFVSHRFRMLIKKHAFTGVAFSEVSVS